MSRPLHKLSQSERGQSLVELAVALPTLLMLLLGMLDVGRLYWALVSLNDAVSEGALYAAAYPEDTANIVERAAESSNALMTLSSGMFSVDYVPPATSGQPITVSVIYDFELVTPIINAIVPSGTLTLNSSDTKVIY